MCIICLDVYSVIVVTDLSEYILYRLRSNQPNKLSGFYLFTQYSKTNTSSKAFPVYISPPFEFRSADGLLLLSVHYIHMGHYTHSEARIIKRGYNGQYPG